MDGEKSPREQIADRQAEQMQACPLELRADLQALAEGEPSA